MPERPLTIATYAAGASLAAITLVYVFGPTFFLDNEAANSSKSSRKKGVVGLTNPANDCFINSVLQALAGLPELRLYLIREIHRRKLGGPELYKDLAAALEEQGKRKNSKSVPEWKLLGLQQGLVTAGLKEVLDALNERPIYKKTISAQAFISVVEHAFRTRISRTQQDAQEFLQIIAERLDDEYHAGRRVRRRARQLRGVESQPEEKNTRESSEAAIQPKQTVLMFDSTSPSGHRDSKISPLGEAPETLEPTAEATPSDGKDDEDGEESFAFPFEGKLESQVECSYCGFKPKPHISSFVTLTLHVPQNAGSTSLNSCFDGMFKQEQIDDFTCDMCRLEHALQKIAKQLSKTTITEIEQAALELDREKIEKAIREDPEKPPKDVKLPDLSTAPKRRISKHMRISTFPRILSLHLSRSVWDEDASSSKNTSKVAFPESLPIGGLLDRKEYRLLGVVTHKGGHNSGHYESFRRQFLSAPYSTPASMGTEGIFSLRSSPAPSPKLSAAPSPRLYGRNSKEVPSDSSLPPTAPRLSTTPPLDSPPSSSASSRSIPSPVSDRRKPGLTQQEAVPTSGLPMLSPETQAETRHKQHSSLSSTMNRVGRKRAPDRWWRISDDKIKESKTSEVLGMQREVYLLFYELADDARY